jgi:hypothetical protein
MQNTERKIKNKGAKKWVLISAYLLGVFVLVYFINLALAPLNNLHKMEQENTILTSSEFNLDSICFPDSIDSLLKEKSYKKALLKLSESDSIQLVINLNDSLVMLSIKGVVIHKTKIELLKKDRFFDKIPLQKELSVFSEPLQIIQLYATIVKEPIVERQAPKDTLEAALNAYQPDTLLQNPAYVWLITSQNFQLIFEQESNKSWPECWVKFNFYSKIFAQKTRQSLTNFMLHKAQTYEPKIIVSMPVDDLRTIYRALPVKPLIVIKL